MHAIKRGSRFAEAALAAVKQQAVERNRRRKVFESRWTEAYAEASRRRIPSVRARLKPRR